MKKVNNIKTCNVLYLQVCIAVVCAGILGLSGCYGMLNQNTSSIWKAIDDDDEKAIVDIVKRGQKLDMVGTLNRESPLEYAMKKHRKFAFKALLECGANPDYFLPNNQTVTFLSAAVADSYWLEHVLAHKADPNLWTKTHRNNVGTPLAATFAYSESPRNIKNAKLLIDAGADLNAKITGNQSPLCIFSQPYSNPSGWPVVLYLLEKGADPHLCPETYGLIVKLQNPDLSLSKDPDFQAVEAFFKKNNLDIAKARWNGNSWDIPKLEH